MSLYENPVSGRDGPFLSGAGSSCRDHTQMGASGMSPSQPPWAHPTPWHRGCSHRRNRTAPVPARFQVPPGLVPLLQQKGRICLKSRHHASTGPGEGSAYWQYGKEAWGTPGGMVVSTRACSRCCSPLSHHKLHSQRCHSWGEALPPPHPLPQGHFHGGTRSAPGWKQCLRSCLRKNVH